MTTITEPCTLIIFGVTGHLSRNKLLPALYHLEEAERLPEKVTIVGFGRRDWTDEQEAPLRQERAFARGDFESYLVMHLLNHSNASALPLLQFQHE